MLETMLLMSSLVALATSNTCPTTFAAACGVPLAYGLNSTQEATILAAHNRLRNHVALGLETRGSPGPQPPASNMRLMTWNVELATLAQSWANQCNFTHDNCGGSTNFSVGQNIYAVIATKLITFNVTQPVGSWYDEVQYFNKSSISPFVYLEKADHYTQVVWANSYYLGVQELLKPRWHLRFPNSSSTARAGTWRRRANS
ncbi:venom allergen 5.02-like isoform X2 [Bacillus rossius redtenbacheri]|uniref:venom allergen 5.02-like isoform X2 n=1 Tax=Bacillus rossius redtenbacheri TaxID=93214 RepID=UPI002FDDDF9F